MDPKMSFFSLLLFVFLLCNESLSSNADDTISAGGSLNGSQTITSKNGNFVMGFFTPGNSEKYYLGIWYNQDRVSMRTVVWVANRDNPHMGLDSCKLKLLEYGNLVIYDDWGESPVWSTYSDSSKSNTTEAVLGDDGNLVLRDKSSPSVVIWQSFDHPTDTWLPGGKIGWNKKTGEKQSLTSWKNQENPAVGHFILELYVDADDKDIKPFDALLHKMSDRRESIVTNYFHNLSHISNANESYFTYNLDNKSILSRFVMDVSGQIKQFLWSDKMEKWNMSSSEPEQLCDVHRICGPSGICDRDTLKCKCLPGFVEQSPLDFKLGDTTGGCRRNTSLQCGSKDVFSTIPISVLPEDGESKQVNSKEECELACRSTCSCNVYAYEAYKNGECQLFSGEMWNVQQGVMWNVQQISNIKAMNLSLRHAASEIRHENHPKEVPGRKEKGKPMIWKIMIPVIVSLVVAIIGVLGCMYVCKRNNANERGFLKEPQGVLTDLLKNKDRNSEGESHELQIFDLVCLATATNNFCLGNKLGQGGFGPVFKGMLQNGQHIAVKRLSKSSGQGIEEFKNEVVLISRLQHRNLVKLLGCCVEGQENMLIYEYMPNKSLDAFLFDPRNKACLDWGKRFNIIGGIARGLLYLHRDSRLRVIHRDLKVSNILLDEDMIPKISDFGMARMFSGNQTSDNTSRLVGTRGYMSPEYMIEGTFSEKSDIFSFGVLVLEVVSGKKVNSFWNPEQPLNLLIHAWRLWNQSKWSEIVDEDLGDLDYPSEVMKCIHIGLLCCQNSAEDRPTMAEIDRMLGNETDCDPSPKEPPYTFPAISGMPDIPLIHCSNNYVSLTTIDGR